MYYVSKVLLRAKNRYLKIEKLAYALIITTRKLLHYFKAHATLLVTNQPLKHILQWPKISGRLIKCPIELGEFYIEYHPRMAIKAQTLTNFIAKSTHLEDTLDSEVSITKDRETEENVGDTTRWKLFVDKSSNQHGSGDGLILRTPSYKQVEYAIRIEFRATNNEAKYEALLARLRIAIELVIESLDIYSDSQLMVNQVQGD